MNRRRTMLAVALLSGSLACSGIACSTADTGARVDPIGPDRASFGPVAEVLVRRCGTLDCHGSTYRNLRLYGYGGLRLRRADGGLILPDERGLDPTEVDADYDAVIAIEPEKMREVVGQHGAGAEGLTFLRKARGAEDHKGNDAITAGDDADRCIVSWLASSTDTGACSRAVPPVSP